MVGFRHRYHRLTKNLSKPQTPISKQFHRFRQEFFLGFVGGPLENGASVLQGFREPKAPMSKTPRRLRQGLQSLLLRWGFETGTSTASRWTYISPESVNATLKKS